MYVEENTIKRSNPPNERNWLKNLIMTGSIIIGFSYLFLMTYSIIWIISLYIDIDSLASSIGIIGISIYNIIIGIGILILLIGFIGISRLVQGSAKITLIISTLVLIFIVFTDVIVSILSSTFIMLKFEAIQIGIVTYGYWIFKMFLIVLALFIVSFTKSIMIDGDSTINFRAISVYILPVWILVIAINAILYFLNIGTLSELFMLIGFLCLSLNQIIYAIEFSLKLKKKNIQNS